MCHHWNVVSTIGCKENEIKLYDSIYINSIASDTAASIASLLHLSSDTVNVDIMNVQRQGNGSDCGLFSIAFMTALCYGMDPTQILFDQSALRHHLITSFEKKAMTPFPEVKGKPARKPVRKTLSISIYCSCRQVERYPMAECDVCKKWYHEKCENIPKEVFKNNDGWMCHDCSRAVQLLCEMGEDS